MYHNKLSLFILYCRMQSLLTVDNSDSSSADNGDCDVSHSIGEQSSAQPRETGRQRKVIKHPSLYNLLRNKEVSTTAVYFCMEL